MKKSLVAPVAGLALSFPMLAFAQQILPPNDAEIVGIVIAANNADINSGKYMQNKAQSKEVKAYAQHMVKEHDEMNDQAMALAKKLNLKPEESMTSRSLKSDDKEALEKLQKRSGHERDKEYIEHEIDLHEKVIESLDKTLLPHAKNAELRSMLTKTRPALVQHLEHAKKLESAME